MSTQTLDRPDVRTTDDPPPMFHYVNKNKVVESVLDGGLVQALCGEIFPVRKSAKPGSPVCPECEEVYKGLKP